jgi:hypothetical protein
MLELLSFTEQVDDEHLGLHKLQQPLFTKKICKIFKHIVWGRSAETLDHH